MKIQIASDLHLEYLQSRFPGETLVKPDPQADLLVLAGDIANGTTAYELFRDWPVPILYVAGNHEFYDGDLDETKAALRAASRPGKFQLLENEEVIIDGVRILGCTLWTDFALYERESPVEMAKEKAKALLRDYGAIKVGERYFLPEDAIAENEVSRSWLENALKTPYDGTTVVITHHAPHPLSIHEQYRGDLTNAAFVNDLAGLLPYAKLWLHGHVHNSFDYRVEGCRVVANPRGYARNRREVDSADQLLFENPAFVPQLVVEV